VTGRFHRRQLTVIMAPRKRPLDDDDPTQTGGFPMRHLALSSAALALLFFGGAVPAAAQNAGGPAMSAQGQGTAQEQFNLSPSKERNMMQALRNEQTQNPPSGFDGRVGSKVPESMSTRPLSNEATAQAPETKGLLFVRLPDRVLLIDPENKAVVEIVADETTTGSAGSNTGGDNK
jgi:hypothetical protein